MATKEKPVSYRVHSRQQTELLLEHVSGFPTTCIELSGHIRQSIAITYKILYRCSFGSISCF